jgi:hypothetical protein
VDYHDHPFWTEQFDSEAALRESNALVFTAEDMIGWTEEDHEIADLAMERDMAERETCWKRENENLRSEVASLRAELAESRGEVYED